MPVPCRGNQLRLHLGMPGDRPNTLNSIKIHHSCCCILVTGPVTLSKTEAGLIQHDLFWTSWCWLFLITLLCSNNSQCSHCWVFLSITVSVVVVIQRVPPASTVWNALLIFSSYLASSLLCSLLVTKPANVMECYECYGIGKMQYWKTNYVSVLMSFSSEYCSY